jgi:hypothetical protein
MPEPEQLLRGKQFQEVVQRDFKRNNREGKAYAEETVSFEGLGQVKQNYGRMDILIAELGDFVTILEIKATDWDRIKPDKVKRNLYRHQRQLFMYVNKYVEIDEVDVCLGLIYPKPPRTPGLRDLIEATLMTNYGVPAYWYSEIRSV